MAGKPDRRQSIKRVLQIVVRAAAALLVAGLLLSLWGGYKLGWSWTGFGEYTVPDESQQRAKTLWDWMELLIIPLVLAGGALWFNRQEREAQRAREKKRYEREEKLADDRQKEDALQTYLDRMTELMLQKGPDTWHGAAREVAQARTLTILRRLDGPRKGMLLRFLHESSLIGKGKKSDPIVDLRSADLSESRLKGANLGRAHLREVDLHRSDLTSANLSRAILRNTDLQQSDLSLADLRDADLTRAILKKVKLSGAKLAGADLTGAYLNDARGTTKRQLDSAKSLKGAYMPDGTKHR